MVRGLLKKIFRKEAKKEQDQNAHSSVMLGSDKYRYVHTPHTATEKTVHQINKYRKSQGMLPL